VEVQFEGGEQGREAVRVFEVEKFAGVELDADSIALGRLVENGQIESGGVDAVHFGFHGADYEKGFGGVGEPGADFQIVWAEDGKGIVVAAFYNRFELGSIHQQLVCHQSDAG
jgi:hypothetical protein